MGKKIAFVIFWLIEEAEEKTNEELEAEIKKEVEGLAPGTIPWMEKLEKVTVFETPTP